jgi:hypothetical protein
MTDNGSPSNHAATLRRAASLASATSARDPTRPRPTASPSVSSKPHCASGPTPRLTRPRISADANSAPYSSVTIGKGRI